MTERGDPSALRWLVGNELRQCRTHAGQTVAEAARTLGCSHAKITHLETGKYQQQPAEIAISLDFYGTQRQEVDRLVTLAGNTNAKTWWAPWANVVPDWFKTFVGLEGLARKEFNYETALIPGLLQTGDYATAATLATGFVRPDHSARFVSFRLARALRLTNDDPLELTAVIEESALLRHVGTKEEGVSSTGTCSNSPSSPMWRFRLSARRMAHMWRCADPSSSRLRCRPLHRIHRAPGRRRLSPRPRPGEDLYDDCEKPSGDCHAAR